MSMFSKKHLIATIIVFTILGLTIVLSYEENRAFIFGLFLRLFILAKKHIILTTLSFLSLTFTKIFSLLLKGIIKRYIIEKIIMGNIKSHFFNYIKEDIKELLLYFKNNFKSLPIVKQIIAIFAFIGSLGFMTTFMGEMIAIKVFLAKVWSFLLALFLKIFNGVIYFITDFLWNGWISPIVEIVVFNWILGFLEKVPYLKEVLEDIYNFFRDIYNFIDYYFVIFIKMPIKRALIFAVEKIKNSIRKLMGKKRVSFYTKLIKEKELNLNKYREIKIKKRVYLRKRENFYLNLKNKKRVYKNRK